MENVVEQKDTEKELQKSILNKIMERELPLVGVLKSKNLYREIFEPKEGNFSYIFLAISDIDVGDTFLAERVYKFRDFVFYIHVVLKDMLVDSLVKFENLIGSDENDAYILNSIDLWKMVAVYCKADSNTAFVFPSHTMIERIWKDVQNI